MIKTAQQTIFRKMKSIGFDSKIRIYFFEKVTPLIFPRSVSAIFTKFSNSSNVNFVFESEVFLQELF